APRQYGRIIIQLLVDSVDQASGSAIITHSSQNAESRRVIFNAAKKQRRGLRGSQRRNVSDRADLQVPVRLLEIQDLVALPHACDELSQVLKLHPCPSGRGRARARGGK